MLDPLCSEWYNEDRISGVGFPDIWPEEEIAMAKHVKRSVIPIYLVGVVWLVFGLFFSLYQPVDYILCALVSVAAFIVGKAIFPDKSYQIAGEEEAGKAEREAQRRAEEGHAAREKAQAERE